MRFFQRHKVAALGLIAGLLLLVTAQGFAGNGDFTFDQTSFQKNGSSTTVEIGGDRATELLLPKEHSPDFAVPLLINLHGYSGNGFAHTAYTYLQEAAEKAGVAYIAPTGSEDSFGSTYWNATTACCDFNNSDVDDIGYLTSLIEEAQKVANIDSKRIYLFGHSNGHFMSYAYLCSGVRKIAAIAGLAGAMEPDPQSCKAAPNNILHIHGEQDGTILYGGGSILGNAYSSVEVTANYWREKNKCSRETSSASDLLVSLDGEETVISSNSCTAGSLEVWSIPEGVHTPALDAKFADSVLGWLLGHSLKA